MTAPTVTSVLLAAARTGQIAAGPDAPAEVIDRMVGYHLGTATRDEHGATTGLTINDTGRRIAARLVTTLDVAARNLLTRDPATGQVHDLTRVTEAGILVSDGFLNPETLAPTAAGVAWLERVA